MYISNICTARTSLLLVFFFPLSLDFGGDRRAGRWEMRCLNTPLLSSLHPTPPHTWDGHFISECSKWKGDLNLPCFPLTPSLSPSPTHRASYCWWTAHCWLSEPAASRPNLVIKNTGYTVVYYLEQILSFSNPVIVHICVFCLSLGLKSHRRLFHESSLQLVWDKTFWHDLPYILHPSVRSLLRVRSLSLLVGHCSHNQRYALAIDFLWIACCRPVH